MRKAVLVFIASLAWFAILIPWQVFADPDAFYHAKISLLLWQRGPLQAFPWLDLTTLGTAFADHHFLFHVIEAPFVSALGWELGARVTTLLLAAVFLTTVYACFRWLGVRYAALWTAALAVTPPLIVRLLLGKASPLALTLFVLGMAAAWKRRPIVGLVIGALFALSHGGWAFLLGSLGLLMIGDIVYRRIVEDEGWIAAMRATHWKEFATTTLGVALGTTIHPNFPENISFLWIQIVKIGLGTPYAHVILGSEWLPAEPGALLASFVLWVVVFVVGLGGLLLARRSAFDKESARATIAFALPVAAFVALTLKSRRNAEYLVPALALWLPWIWNMIDPRRLADVGRRTFGGRRTSAVLVGVIVAIAVGKGAVSAYKDLRTNAYPDDIYRVEMTLITERANPGDRVFHSDWDEFPMLFNIDDRLRYIAGLDPTFLYEASSTLSDAYRHVTWGVTTATADEVWDVIHARTQSRFVFIAKRDHQKLLDVIKSDKRYELLAETEDAATFQVKAPAKP